MTKQEITQAAAAIKKELGFGVYKDVINVSNESVRIMCADAAMCKWLCHNYGATITTPEINSIRSELMNIL